MANWFIGLKQQPLALFTLLLYMFALVFLYLFLRRYIPELALFLSNMVRPAYGIWYVVASVFATILHFMVRYFNGIYLWSLFFFGVRSQVIDPYMGVLFYLISIPLWLYYAWRFIRYIEEVNRAREYVFTSETYQQRFFSVLSVLLYGTITLVFLRQALLLAFPKSDAPRVLQALNFILLQGSLILMISREQLLRFVPHTTAFWESVYEYLDTYYYLFVGLVAFVIIMSNPYIGYGPLFFYTITRLLLIALLIPLFVMVHDYTKRWVGSFFFYADREGIQERFKHGKTAYGLFVIASFLFFTALAIIIAANIWGYAIGLDDLYSLLHRKVYGYVSSETGRMVEVDILNIVKVFLYIIGGIVVAYGVNTFILHRMFDLLLVNIGVQNALLALTRYIIILIAIIIGLQSIGLSHTLLYIFAVLGGLGVAGKEIITDLLAYFIILIQRPLKIGDFVLLDPQLRGTVRHLTLRSIIMRNINNITVIVPNSFILSRPITNWNYARTYFAFEDMFLTVTYTSDPLKVKELILEVLDKDNNVLKNPPPIVRLNNFADNGFQFMVRGFLSQDKVLKQFDVTSDIRLAIVVVLRSHGYDVGSPTRILKIMQEKPASPSEPDKTVSQ